MNERDVVYVGLGPDSKPHPGVVLRISEDGTVVVICGGTGTERKLTHVAVRARSRSARAMGLYKDTFFYPSGIVFVAPSLATATGARCPPDTFGQLEVMATPVLEAHTKTFMARKRGP